MDITNDSIIGKLYFKIKVKKLTPFRFSEMGLVFIKPKRLYLIRCFGRSVTSAQHTWSIT
jgi:hypothetical protein